MSNSKSKNRTVELMLKTSRAVYKRLIRILSGLSKLVLMERFTLVRTISGNSNSCSFGPAVGVVGVVVALTEEDRTRNFVS